MYENVFNYGTVMLFFGLFEIVEFWIVGIFHKIVV